MGCGCGNKTITVAPYVPPINNIVESNCIIIYLNELKAKLLNMKTTNIYINTTSNEVNSFLGFIQTMEDYNNYCLYDLSSIQSRLVNVI